MRCDVFEEPDYSTHSFAIPNLALLKDYLLKSFELSASYIRKASCVLHCLTTRLCWTPIETSSLLGFRTRRSPILKLGPAMKRRLTLLLWKVYFLRSIRALVVEASDFVRCR